MNLIDALLSTHVGAGRYRCSIYISTSHIAVVSWKLSKDYAISLSDTEATMFFNILRRSWIDPFRFGFDLSKSLIKSLRK